MISATELSQMTRSLKGAPAAILLALLLYSGPQKVKSLCLYTDFSDKVVRQGLVQLKALGLAAHDSDLRAWSLVKQAPFLALLQQAMAESAAPAGPHRLSERTVYVVEEAYPLAGEEFTQVGAESAASGNGERQETAVRPLREAEDFTAVGEDFTKKGVDFTAGRNGGRRETAVRLLREAEDFTTVGEDFTKKGVDFTASGNGGRRETAVRPLREAEDFTAVGEDSTKKGVDFTAGGNGGRRETAVRMLREVEDFTAVGEDFTKKGVDFTASGNGGQQETAVRMLREAEDFTTVGEDFTKRVVDFTRKVAESTVSAEESSGVPGPITTFTTTTKPTPQEGQVVSKQVKAANGHFPGNAPEAAENPLADWLARGGIGRKTPKMRELLASDLDLQTVKAHVLERQAWAAGLLPDGPDFLPGLLIHKLLGGDPPPPMRCEYCLRLPDKLGLCRCDYDQLVQR